MNNLIQMNDFNSDFWHWFILITTLASILWVAAIAYFNSTSRTQDVAEGDDPETMGHVWDEDLEEFNNPLPRWWLNMLYLTIAFGLVYLVLFPGLGKYPGLLDWTQRGQYEEQLADTQAKYAPIYDQYAAMSIEELSGNDAAQRTAKHLFSTNCALCHSDDARGAINYPNLRDSDWIWGNSAEEIHTSISKGRNAAMPAWGAPLGEDGVIAVTAYVQSLSGTAGDAAQIEAGKTQFATFCAACHNADGTGNKAFGAPNLTDNTWLYGGDTESIMHSIRAGRSGVMPAQEQQLSDVQIKLLASYIYSFAQNPE